MNPLMVVLSSAPASYVASTGALSLKTLIRMVPVGVGSGSSLTVTRL